MVKGLPLCGVCQPVPEALDGEKTLCVEFLNLENGTEVFMVTGAFHGQQIAVLLDTGAGLTFIAAEVVNRLQLKTRTVPPINIRLGNGSVESVNELVEDTFHLNNMAIPVQAYVMSLPPGIQIIVGMPTMVELDIWLHPATKRLKVMQHQNDVTLNYVDTKTILLEEQNRNKPIAGLYVMPTSSPDVVEGHSSTPHEKGDGQYSCDIELVTDAKIASKLRAAYDAGRLDWNTYTDPKLRGKKCAYAQAIANDRVQYAPDTKGFASQGGHSEECSDDSQSVSGMPMTAAVVITSSGGEVLLSRSGGGVYTLPQSPITAASKRTPRRPRKQRDKELDRAAHFCVLKLHSKAQSVKLNKSEVVGSVQMYNMEGHTQLESLDSNVDCKFFDLDTLPTVSESDRAVIERHYGLQQAQEVQCTAYLAQLFVNPDIDGIVNGDKAAQKHIDELLQPNRKRLSVEGANQLFDMQCRQSKVSDHRKSENANKKRRSLAQPGGIRYIYAGKATSKRAREPNKRKSITFNDKVQINIPSMPESDANKSIKSGGQSGQLCDSASENTCSQTSELKCNTNPDGANGTLSQSIEALNVEEKPRTTKSRERKRILELMTAHACDSDADPGSQTELYRPKHEIVQDLHDWEALRHVCCKMSKAKYSDKAEMPELDSQTVEEYFQGNYPIDIDEIDKTIESQKEWVKGLQEGALGDFKCLKPVEKFTRHPNHEKAHFDIIPGKTPKQPPRHRCPVHLLEELKKFHIDMYRRGFIKPIMDANHLSPVIVLKKPDNPDGSSRGYRFVVSMVEMNECLQKCNNRIPLNDELFDRLKNSYVISTFDLTTGYWLCELDDSTSRLCAFQSEYGAWAYRVLPMGASPSGPIFNEWVTRIFRRYNVLVGREQFAGLDDEFEAQVSAGENSKLEKGEKCNKLQISDTLKYDGKGFLDTFLDDAIASSMTCEEHRAHVLLFLKICSYENLPLQFKKCTWFTRFTRYLGIVVGSGMLMTDPLKVKAIMKMVRPRNAGELKSFIGAAGWMRRFIPSFAARQHLLNQLQKKGVNFAQSWTEEHTAAWLDIKKALMTYPTLRCFNPDLPIYVYSDSSQHHCGGALIQFYDDTDEYGKPNGKKIPAAVAYHSRSFIPAESKYSSQEREMLGVVSCCECFKHYLISTSFVVRVVSDHESLQYCKLNKIEANRVSRWTMKMSQYQYIIEYAKGSTHHVPDILSRAIELPNEAWTRRTPIDNDDDFLSTPFMMFWPGVHMGYLVATQKGSKVMLGGGGESTCANMNASTTTSAQNGNDDEYRTGYDESLDDPNQYMYPHEKILFGYMSQRPVPTDLLFKESDYLRCKDFGQLYDCLQRQGDSNDDKQAQRRTLLHKIDGDATITIRYESKADLAQALKHYFIDGGYLYKRDTTHGAVLCVPDAMATSVDCDKDAVNDRTSLRRLLFNELHSQPCGGHRGIAATELALRRRYHWPHMCDSAVQKDGLRHSDSVREMIRRCATCNQSKIDRTKPQGMVQPVQTPRAPAQSYNLDLIVGLPKIETTEGDYSKILVAVDRFSSRTFLMPCLTNVTASLLGEIFVDCVCLEHGRGIPVELISDRDPLMTSGLWQSIFNRFGTVLRFTCARNQQANGKVERQIAVIEELLRMNISFDQRNWLELLPHIMYVLNATFKNSLAGISPMMAEMGIQPLMPIDLHAQLRPKQVEQYKYRGKGNPQTPAERITSIMNLREKLYEALIDVRDRMVDDGDRRRRTINELIQPGTKAWIRVEGLHFDEFNKLGSRKLQNQWYGPFDVTERVSTNSFRLDIGEEARGRGTHDVFPVRVLRAYVHDSTSPPLTSKSLPDEEDETEYEIDQLLAVRANGDKLQFLTSFKGYSARLSSMWLDEEGLTHGASELLAEFKAKNEMPALPPKRAATRRSRRVSQRK